MTIHRKKDLLAGREGYKLAGAMERIRNLSRRDMLKGGAVAFAGMLAGSFVNLFGPVRDVLADEAVKTGQFVFPRLKFAVNDGTGDIWNTGPIGDATLRQHLKKLTNINASEEAKVVRLSDFDDLCQNPFVFMTSQGHFKLDDSEEKNLREFLERGGFVHADDCVFPAAKGQIIPTDLPDGVLKPRAAGTPDIDRFFRDYVGMINRLFPDNPMRRVPADNEIYHVYYDFKECPHMQGVQHGMFGLFEPKTARLMTICTSGDLHCGWMDQYWPHEKNLEAIKMGINIIIYVLSH